ncbi:Cytosolic non-specific dipeptidase, partial [Trichinella papuae]
LHIDHCTNFAETEFQSTMSSKEKDLQTIFKYVDEHVSLYVERLAEAVAIESVSAEKKKFGELIRMAEWTKNKLELFGTVCELVYPKSKQLDNGEFVKLPPVLLGQLGSDPKKVTLLIYGHLDVQPAEKAINFSDGWDTEPFVLVEKDGKLYGRGSTDDKGPVIAWINIIEAFHCLKIEMPVNVKFCFELMEESGSVGLEDVLRCKKDEGWFQDVDCACISDNYWVGTKKPCITYGLRGLCYTNVEVTCCNQDLHSGVFGGSIHEAMSDLIYLLDNLVDKNGKILIPKIYDKVDPLTDKERDRYESIDFDCESYRKSIGASKLLYDNKAELLMHRWRYPSLSIHGISGAFSGNGEKTVIPCKVTGKFSIRLVPSQNPEEIAHLVEEHIKQLHNQRGSLNKCHVHSSFGPHWLTDVDHPNFLAGRQAIRRVYQVEPDLTREGGSIPVTLALQKYTGKNVVLLPIGAADDMAHSQNEKFNKDNYILGMKMLGAYFYELAEHIIKEIP